jgi:hypothetical protein
MDAVKGEEAVRTEHISISQVDERIIEIVKARYPDPSPDPNGQKNEQNVAALLVNSSKTCVGSAS